jgi:hypothetical protein
MAQIIAASVGRLGGLNRPPDVKVVQELLNRVPSAAGGPYPLLAVDSVCGPRTVDAIQKFQVQQLGWGKADGRVDPNGPTFQKLNELSGPTGAVSSKVLTANSRFYCPHGAPVTVTLKGLRSPGPTGAPVLRAVDDFTIVGCIHPLCCARVNWVVASDPLSENNIGICVGVGGAPLGKVRIVTG